MAKFFGQVGYVETVPLEAGSDVYIEKCTERNYYGDILKDTSKRSEGESLNDKLSLGNTFSIVADAFAYQNYYAIKYVRYLGVCWNVTSVEVQRPRLTLSVGGVYVTPEN